MRLFLIFAAMLYGGAARAQSALKSPDVSANALFLYRQSNLAKGNADTERNGIDIQEAELAFYSEVDPYSRLNVLLSIHPEYELDAATGRVNESWAIEPEEAYAESNRVPLTTLKAGKFKAAFGKHNPLHTHVFPFVDAPVANRALLGEEGLNDVGLSAAVLLPFSWYSEVTGQYLRGEGENAEFNSPTPGDAVALGHWKNLWDITEALTLEAGLSYAQGNNSLGGATRLGGADLTFKWRPVDGGKYHSAILGAEYLERGLEQPGVQDEKGRGGNVWGQYQFAQRWSALARYDQLQAEGADAAVNPEALTNGTVRKYSAALVFGATEFSAFKLEYDHGDGAGGERKIYIQANFTIGAHPSHSY
jgi:hypothetical protein